MILDVINYCQGLVGDCLKMFEFINKNKERKQGKTKGQRNEVDQACGVH